MRLPALLVVLVMAAPVFAQKRAELPWWERAQEARVGPYWIKTDLPAAQANRLTHHLELMYLEYSKRLASLPQRAPHSLNVLIFSRQQEYLNVLRTKYGINATGTGGLFFVNALGSGLAFWTENLPQRRIEHVMQHEGFHQFAFSRFGGDLPIWVNEGLAEFFGDSVMVRNRLILGQTNPRVLDQVRAAIEDGRFIPFQRMLAMTSAQWREALREGTAAGQYNQAWSMVHFLVYGDGGKYQQAFEVYLRLLNDGVLSEEAFRRAFGAEGEYGIQKFEERWREYALAARPSAFITAMERIEFLAEGALALSRKGVVPGSLDELQEALVGIEFTHRVAKHGQVLELRYDDPSLFQIPLDDIASEQPVFVVEKPNLARLPRRLRRFEEDRPTPSTIGTDALKPRRLSVRWLRDEEEPTEFGYEIVVR